jgi:hypothetical protein
MDRPVVVGVAEGLVVGVAEGLDEGAADGSCSQDGLLASVAALVVVTARVTPETTVSRTPPAIRATAAGRGCANRMNAYRCFSLLLGNGSLD